MDISIFKMLEKIKNSYIVFEKESKEILYANQKAREFMGDFEGNINLGFVFDSCSLIDNFFLTKSNGEISDIDINIAKTNHKSLVSLYLGYFNDEQTQIFLEIEPNYDIKKMFDIMQELSPDVLFLIDIQKSLLFFRGELSNKLGLPNNVVSFPQALVDFDIINPDDVDTYLVCAEDLLDGIQRSCDLRIKLSGGDYNWFRLSSVIVCDDYEQPIKALGKLKNVQKEKDLEFKLSHDLLTRTLNKISFINHVTEILHSSDESETHALYFVDIDEFTCINNKYSPNFGDELLKNIAKILRSCVRDTDIIGRVGIDEFVIFVSNIDCDTAITNKANLLLRKIEQKFVYGDDSYTPNASIGVAKYPTHGKTYNELYKKSDIALYNSKAHGKNTSTIFSDTLG